MDSSVRIEEIAAGWLAKRDGGNWSARDEFELDTWLKSSTAHWAAYVRLRAGWEQASRLKAIGAGLTEGTPPPRDERRFVPFFGTGAAMPAAEHSASPVQHVRRFVPWAVAAVVLLAVMFVALEQGVFGAEKYSTPVGGISALPLADGSQVTLNTASDIRVSMGKTERRVDLKKGEAFFNVAKDPARPFIVSAGERRVVVVGTQFSVRRDRDAVRIVVTEGKVLLAGEGERSDGGTLLSAGAVAYASGADAGVEVGRYPVPEAEEYLAWRSGFIVFRDVELSAAVDEFNRYLHHKIVIQDPAIAAIRIGGNFRLTNVDAFLRILRNDFPIEVSHRGDRIVLSGG